MRRLYLQVYLTIIAILVLVVVVIAALWRAGEASRFDHASDIASDFVATALPPAASSRAVQQEALEALHRRLRGDLALYAPDGTLLASAGRPMPPLRLERATPGWRPGPAGVVMTLRLEDGRWLVARLPRGPWRPGAWLITILVALGLAVAVGAWPISRRLTRRLERLKSGVEQLGGGDLAARVKIEGKDEVAALAESFNRAAARIEDLVRSHKMLLANCSHELRTPLTRINLALALVGESIEPARRDQLKADIAELDQLIGEILLASRLDAIRAPERTEEVELLALTAEEAARYDVSVEGETAMVRGDPSLLRRMIRNLLENARRYGGAAPPEVRVGRTGDRRAWVEVRDHGPGVSDGEREKIFEPFYRLSGSTESGRGSGLGLSLVRQIASSHGGHAQCLAAAGGGSAFRVLLPAAA
jgi:signal transduction histidine kinase